MQKEFPIWQIEDHDFVAPPASLFEMRFSLNDPEREWLDAFKGYADAGLPLPPAGVMRDFLKKVPILAEGILKDEFVQRYGFAVPCCELVDIVSALDAPILSVGCGTGYLERLLVNAGVDVVATDKYPVHLGRNRYIGGIDGCLPSYMPEVIEMEAAHAVMTYPDRAVLMSWPSHGRPWGYNAARRIRSGGILIYIGEQDGCTGCHQLSGLLRNERAFQLIGHVAIPKFRCLHDACFIYRKV